MFVVTESGQTHSITLSPKERLTAQTVTLKESGTFSSFNGPAVSSELSGLPYEERIQTALKHIPQLRGYEGEALGGTLAGRSYLPRSACQSMECLRTETRTLPHP